MICKRSKKANFTHRDLGLLDGRARDLLAGRRAQTQAWCPQTGAPQAPRELSAPGGRVGQGRVLRPECRKEVLGSPAETLRIHRRSIRLLPYFHPTSTAGPPPGSDRPPTRQPPGRRGGGGGPLGPSGVASRRFYPT